MFYWRWLNRPRHPLLQLLFAAIGIVALVGVLMLGFFALLAFAFIGGIVALVRALTGSHNAAQGNPGAAGKSDPNVIEGEYVIVRQDTTPLEH